MEKTGKILEKDLYWPVHNYFKKLGYDVHGEVKDCDITAFVLPCQTLSCHIR
jgi:hypothetical protein